MPTDANTVGPVVPRPSRRQGALPPDGSGGHHGLQGNLDGEGREVSGLIQDDGESLVVTLAQVEVGGGGSVVVHAWIVPLPMGVAARRGVLNFIADGQMNRLVLLAENSVDQAAMDDIRRAIIRGGEVQLKIFAPAEKPPHAVIVRTVNVKIESKAAKMGISE